MSGAVGYFGAPALGGIASGGDFGGWASAHSLRAGFVTEAARRGVAMPDTTALTTHRSVETLRRYYRPAGPAANPAARL